MSVDTATEGARGVYAFCPTCGSEWGQWFTSTDGERQVRFCVGGCSSHQERPTPQVSSTAGEYGHDEAMRDVTALWKTEGHAERALEEHRRLATYITRIERARDEAHDKWLSEVTRKEAWVSDLERDYGKMSAALGRTRDERDAAVRVVECDKVHDEWLTREPDVCSCHPETEAAWNAWAAESHAIAAEKAAALAAYDAAVAK